MKAYKIIYREMGGSRHSTLFECSFYYHHPFEKPVAFKDELTALLIKHNIIPSPHVASVDVQIEEA